MFNLAFSIGSGYMDGYITATTYPGVLLSNSVSDARSVNLVGAVLGGASATKTQQSVSFTRDTTQTSSATTAYWIFATGEYSVLRMIQITVAIDGGNAYAYVPTSANKNLNFAGVGTGEAYNEIVIPSVDMSATWGAVTGAVSAATSDAASGYGVKNLRWTEGKCVGTWGAWGECAVICGGGSQTRSFTVTTVAAYVACPNSPQTQSCDSCAAEAKRKGFN